MFYLISSIMLHLEVCGAHGVLVAPKSPSAAFWPIVFHIERLRASVRQVI